MPRNFHAKIPINLNFKGHLSLSALASLPIRTSVHKYVWKTKAILSYHLNYQEGLRQKLQVFAVVVLFLRRDHMSSFKIILPTMLTFQPIPYVLMKPPPLRLAPLLIAWLFLQSVGWTHRTVFNSFLSFTSRWMSVIPSPGSLTPAMSFLSVFTNTPLVEAIITSCLDF